MTRYRARIDQMSVGADNRYIVYSRVAGLIGQHRTLSGAQRSLRCHEAGCRIQGGYSDAHIYVYDPDNGWTVVDA